MFLFFIFQVLILEGSETALKKVIRLFQFEEITKNDDTSTLSFCFIVLQIMNNVIDVWKKVLFKYQFCKLSIV